MSVERTFGCDGPGCLCNVTTQAERPPTFVTVFEEPGHPHERRHEHHFCSWDCVLKYAATFEPGETIPFPPATEEGRDA